MDYSSALSRFLDMPDNPWRTLPFFTDGTAARIMASLDAEVMTGQQILPSAHNLFAAMAGLTPADVRVVILGQDPYPTPGHAHGLAFSYLGCGALPRSLGNIFRELASDTGCPAPVRGDLTPWARQGVLLLNTALSVRAGAAGSHEKLGWNALADQALALVSASAAAAVFVLWGAKAQARAGLIDTRKHLVLESAHPSPLSARRGFFGSKPFSTANRWLAAHGQTPVNWALD